MADTVAELGSGRFSMRVNGAMGVIAVSCVVAVVNGATISAIGRSHMKTHHASQNVRRFTAMEFADARMPPEEPEPALETTQSTLHGGHFITLPDFTPEKAANDIDLPPEPVHFNFAPPLIFGGLTPPLKTPPPTPPDPPPPPGPPPVTFRAAAAVEVPEPSTWAMMMLGFGAIGAMLRRRREAEGYWQVRRDRAG